MLTRDFNLRCQSTISSIFVSVFSFSVLMLVWLVSFTIDSASFKLSVSFPGFVPHAFPGSVFSDSTRREEAWTPPQVYQEPQNDKNIVNDDSGSSFFLLQDIKLPAAGEKKLGIFLLCLSNTPPWGWGVVSDIYVLKALIRDFYVPKPLWMNGNVCFFILRMDQLSF